MVMDTRIRDLTTRVATEVKGKASAAALALTNAEVSRNAMGDGTNRVTNAALKDAVGGLAAGWTRSGPVNATNVVDIADFPGAAWKFDGVGTQIAVYSPFFDVIPGESYAYSGVISGALVGTYFVTFRVEWRNRSNDVISPAFSQNVSLPTGAGEKLPVNTTVIVPQGAVRARLILLNGGAATGGSWYASDIAFRRIPSEIAAGGYLNEASLKGMYPVYRVKSGGAYPARIAGALNIFFGDTDPGLAMAAGDYWANPAATTLSSVAASAADSSSALYSAIITAAGVTEVQLSPVPLAGASYGTSGSTPNRIFGVELPKSGQPELAASGRIPAGWTNVRVAFAWVTGASTSTAANCRFFVDTTRPRQSTARPLAGQRYTATVPITLTQGVSVFRGGASTPVTEGDEISIYITRDASGTFDTYTGSAIILAVWLEKM